MGQPQVESRDERPYAAIQATISTMAEFRAAADPGFPELFAWLETRGIDADGPPFIRYIKLGADGQPREIELGAPLSAPAPSSLTNARLEPDPSRWRTELAYLLAENG